MFNFAADNQSDSEEEELDFSETRNKGAGLGNIFGGTSLTHKAESNAALVYQAPKQPRDDMRNVEIVQSDRAEERLEVMSSVRSGVKMATAVSAYNAIYD